MIDIFRMKSSSQIGSSVPGDGAVYDWERFWVGRTAMLDLSDGGFLVDPENPPPQAHPGRPMRLAELRGYRALGLLGEPGIGKSTALEIDAAQMAHPSDVNIASVHVDLRAYSSEGLLYQRLFGSEEFTTWTKGNSQLVLFLDSLDEALLRIDSIANLLASELARYPASRLSVRIACRTAVWPSRILEPALHRIWGEDNVGMFELAPLRRRDVMAAAGVEGVDPRAFIEQLYSANAVPFAIKPLTLRFLLGLYKRDGNLPRSIAELYTRGCLKLCEETNASRRDAGRLGALSAKQRLRLAGRLAAATILANRFAIWPGPEADGIPPEDVALSELCGGREEGDFHAWDVTESHIREVLDTGLFSSRGGVRMGWAHQSYAEFLAAQYLLAKEVSPRNILGILRHPAGGLVPQLSGTAAWCASLSKDIRHALIQSEPLTLLRGDLASWPEEDLALLTASLLEAMDRQVENDFIPGIATYYERLTHPGLAAQLRPYIEEASKNIVCRRAAIMIAEACKLGDLQPELVRLATDLSVEPSLRAPAVAALGTCGDDSVREHALALAKGSLGPDPNDDLKGHALRILWPAHLSAPELFDTITQPNEGYLGAYVVFLTGILPETLTPADLPCALTWAACFIRASGSEGDFHRKSLADSILIAAWKHLDNPEIIGPLLNYVSACLHPWGDLLRGTDYRAQEGFLSQLKSDAERRRKFVRYTARRPVAKMECFNLRRANLLQLGDFSWLLSLSPAGAAPDAALDEKTLCNMVEITCHLDDTSDFEALYDAAGKWPQLRQRYADVLDGVPLDSPDAGRLRQLHRQIEGLKENQPPPVEPPPADRVAGLLVHFEAGDWQAWWRLNMELTLTPTSRSYGSDLDYFITEMPGWHAANERTRQRLLSAAAQYLISGESSVTEWIGTNSLRREDVAAYRAMVLLKQQDPSAYKGITRDTWEKWVAAVVALPRDSIVSEKSKLQAGIIADALNAAPKEFVSAVREIMRKERARVAGTAADAPAVRGASFFVLRELEAGWDSACLKEAVFEELCDGANSVDQFSVILEVLLAAKFVPARDHAIMVLEQDHAQRRPYALAAASGLARHFARDAWPTIWKFVTEDEFFGREFFLNLPVHYGLQDGSFAALDEQQLAELYVLLQRLFPRADDPQHPVGRAHWVGPHESVAHLRDSLPRQIVVRGTIAAVEAMGWTIAQLPDLDWLGHQFREAEHVMRLRTWPPMKPGEIFRLTDDRRTLLVQSAEDLCGLLTEALRKYEARLHGEQTPVRALWDRQKSGPLFRPVEEEALSDDVVRFLRQELVENGAVANREVEIGRVPGAPIGKRTDIRIDALRRSAAGVAYDRLTAVIETKGCWNAALFTALNDQLYRDYMVRLQAPVGIYLVGWFDRKKWDPEDPRLRHVPDCTLLEAQVRLDEQAAAIPAGFVVKAAVLDCHMH
jgi:hypothetical protein